MRWRSRLLLLPFIASGCSLLTSLSGLSNGTSASSDAAGESGTQDDGAAAVTDVVGIEDTGSRIDANPNRLRAWRQVNVNVGVPPARHSARMAYDPVRERAVVFGGEGAGPGSDTWEWDGTAWSLATLAKHPTGTRKAPGFTYANDRHVVLLYGGGGAGPNVWEWDGGLNWGENPTGSPSPSARHSPGLTFDTKRNVVVLFGGAHVDGGAVTDEMWDWTVATGFRAIGATPRPSARQGHVMVFDVKRERIVLFGGLTGPADLSNETWEYDGTSWALRTTTTSSPPARVAACAAYDSTRGKTVVFGGRNLNGATSLADTWEWDGTTWTQGPNGPSARRTCAMAFDVARDSIVLFGGATARINNISMPIGDTWLYE